MTLAIRMPCSAYLANPKNLRPAIVTETLIMQFDRAAPGHACWRVFDSHGNGIGYVQRGELRELAPQAAHRQLIVLTPGQDSTLLDANIPTRNRQKLLQALPYALEDRLSSDIDELHFAPGPLKDAQAVPVAVTAHTALQAWQAMLADAGLSADAMLPDFLALPRMGANWSLAIQHDCLLVRENASHGFAIRLTLAQSVLAMALTTRSPAGVDLYYDPADEAAADTLAQLALAHDIPCSRHPGPVADVLLNNAGTKPVLNLLQGRYQVKRESQQRWRPWRLPAGLATAALLLFIASQILGYFSLRSAEAALDTEIEQLFRSTFPDVQRIVDARAQMENRLALLRGGNKGETGVVPLLIAIGDALQQAGNANLDAFSFRAGTLDVSILADDVQTLDRIKQALIADTGLQVEIQAANNRGERVEGRMQIIRQAP